jgi:nucleoside-diphosphate-sugar epimerase
MKIAVLGAAGGLGRNVLDAAIAAGHEVVALVREPGRVELPAGVRAVAADATRVDDIVRGVADADATVFCVNPPFAKWLTTFPPLLDAAITATKQTKSRLVFPANVWIYGPGRAGEVIDETRAPSPTSRRGTLRAAMEMQLHAAEICYAMVRLPEFYGPSVTTLTGRVFRAAMTGARTLWPGSLDLSVELIYMPDAARALLEVATAHDGDGANFHLPGVRTTPREFVTRVYGAAGAPPRMTGVPPWLLSLAGVFDATARGAADIAHLWTHPVLLDGTRFRARFGEVPTTPIGDAITATVEWHRARPTLRMQG